MRVLLGLRRALPVHCDACRAETNEINERISRYRRFEDVAAAFAMIGLLAWLRQSHGRVVEPAPAPDYPDGGYTADRRMDIGAFRSDDRIPLLANANEILVAVESIYFAMRRLGQWGA